MLNVFRVPVGIGKDDAPAIEGKPTSGEIDVADGNVVDIGGISLTAITTPGHTDGSTCYVLSDTDDPDGVQQPVLRGHAVSGRAGQVEEPSRFFAIGGVDYV